MSQTLKEVYYADPNGAETLHIPLGGLKVRMVLCYAVTAKKFLRCQVTDLDEKQTEAALLDIDTGERFSGRTENMDLYNLEERITKFPALVSCFYVCLP